MLAILRKNNKGIPYLELEAFTHEGFIDEIHNELDFNSFKHSFEKRKKFAATVKILKLELNKDCLAG
jgi:hypothetical protein